MNPKDAPRPTEVAARLSRLLIVQWRTKTLTEISFNTESLGTATANEECAEVSPSGGNNAIPFVVGFPIRSHARVKVIAFPNVERGELIGVNILGSAIR